MEKIVNYINNSFVESKGGQFIENCNPATGEVYSMVTNSNKEDVDLAVSAAKEAFPKWKSLSFEDRTDCLNKLADLIEENLEELAKIESIDNGKPITLARKVDIPRSSTNFRFFADHAKNYLFSKDYEGQGSFNKVTRQPLGVTVCISPWNLPLYLFTWKIAPALISGNTVVAKPSEVTPMSAFFLSKLIDKAGFPPGVLNIIHGTGSSLGDHLVGHPDVKAVSFTGSTKTGSIIANTLSSSFKKYSLEMGGKNPSIVFDDCDYDKTLQLIKRAAFTNQGQICLCGSRILLQKSIYDKFKQDLIAEVEKYKIGNPLEDSTEIGAVVSKEHFEKIMNCLETAKKEGGKILCGGESLTVEGKGYFIKPTLIEGLNQDCKTNREEIFGPVATLIPFETTEEAIEIANSTEYGLAANIHTKNKSTAVKVSNELDYGIVWVNCWLVRDLRTPFGGFKNSGFGREGGDYALNFFTEPKNVCSLDKDIINE